MHNKKKKNPVGTWFLSLLAFFTAAISVCEAKEGLGAPEPKQIYFQKAASPVMEEFVKFHDGMMWLITAISLFVLALMVYVAVRFNAKANPVPSTTTHNTTLEIIWTVVPVFILAVVVVFSMRILYLAERVPAADMTLKITGYQWYWGYEYPDHGGINFMSYMIPDKDIKEGQLRLLETDTQVVLPVDTTVRLQITAADVLHAWAIPAFGVKMDAVPGKLNETWVKITKPGTYYGQCSELCGAGHGFMPIMVKAVSKEDFAAWVKQQTGQKK